MIDANLFYVAATFAMLVFVGLVFTHVKEQREREDTVKRYFEEQQQKLEEERRRKLDEVNP